MSGAMSAIGTKRTYRVAPHMSAFGGKADIYWMMPGILYLPSCRGAKARICIRSSTVVTRQKGATCSDAVEANSR